MSRGGAGIPGSCGNVSLLRADALALSLRAALVRLALPLARAADAFLRLEGWSHSGYARLGDHAGERFGRAAASHPADVFLRLRLPASLAADLLAAVASAHRRLRRRVEQVPPDRAWPEAHPPGSLLAARMFSIRRLRAPAWVGLLALLEDFVITWDNPGASPRRQVDAVYIRDGWRCTAPGCTSRRNLEDHHIVYRSRGGGDELSNRTCLCRFHHRLGEHGDRASCRGTAPLGVIWRLGRDGIGARYRNERRVS